MPRQSKNYQNNNIIFNLNLTKRKTVKARTNLMSGKRTSNSLIRKQSFNSSEKIKIENKSKDDTLLDDIDFNLLPYAEAIKKDHRDFFKLFLSIFKLKIEFIALLFYPENFTYKPYTLSMYTLGLIFGFFSNSILYTDDIVSEKYHNNGKLNFLTTIFLSLTSNFISWLISCLCKNFFIYHESLILLVKEVKRKSDYILTFMRLYLVIKIKSFGYYLLSFIFIITMTYYLMLFCTIYHESQKSLLINYMMGIIESLITSICITLIICVFRLIGLNYKNKYLYRTSVFIDQKI